MRALNQVLTLTLCAAFILPAPAHSQPANLSDETNCVDNPTIYVSVCDNETLYKYCNTIFDSSHKRNVSIPFGSSVKVRCTGRHGAKGLTLTRDGQNLDTKIDPFSISWSTRKLDLLKSEYKYECTYVETTCMRSVITLITPGLEVTSVNLQISFQDNGPTNYIVQYGESMSVLCFGPDAARLVMSRDGETLLPERESDAIKRFEVKPDLQISEFVCTDVNTTYNGSATIRVVPTIYFQSRNETIAPNYMYFDNQHYNLFVYYFDYSDSIEMYCSGPRAVKLIPHGGEDTSLTTENCNSNTVKYTQKIKLVTSDFRCTASDFSDYVTNVRVILTPRMEVKSPLILRVESIRGVIQYTIKYGAPLEIICSETDATQLRIRYKYSENCAGQIVNETAIKCLIEKVNEEDNKMDIECYNRLRNSYGDKPVRVQVGVLPPDVVDFRCVSHNMVYLNCSWTAPSRGLNFTLSYVENGILTNMCVKRPWRMQLCVWEFDDEYNLYRRDVLNLILQWCNNVGCSNKTFLINHMSIMRPAPPRRLELLKTTADGAVLQCYAGDIEVESEYLTLYRLPMQYKAQYWYSGILETRDLNSSLVTCESYFCQIALNLPCPGMFYQVWIYQKPLGAGEDFWSEPALVSFHTTVVEKNEDNRMNDDPSCTWKPKKNAEVMKYFVGERKRDVHLEMETLKEAVSSLKDKLAATQAYLEQRGKGTN